MNKLTLKCFVDERATKRDRSLSKVISDMGSHFPINVIIEEIPMNKFQWVKRNNRPYVSDSTVYKYVNQDKKNIDMILFFVDFKNWKTLSRGFKLGRLFNTFRVCFTKYRRGYEDTVEHEILHALKDFIYYHLGIKLKHVFGVKDFDKEVVHYRNYRKDYDYDDRWEIIAPLLHRAIAVRRGSQIKIASIPAKIKQTFVWNSNNIEENFEKAIVHILKFEGGYVNDPKDPGGETKYGISKRAYPKVDIKKLTVDEAKNIYYNDYWLKSKCDKMNYKVATVVFDMAVNAGVKTSAKILQRALGVSSDGIIGPITLSVLKGAHNDLFLDVSKERMKYYTKLSNFKYFGRGWTNRVFDLLKELI